MSGIDEEAIRPVWGDIYSNQMTVARYLTVRSNEFRFLYGNHVRTIPLVEAHRSDDETVRRKLFTEKLRFRNEIVRLERARNS